MLKYIEKVILNIWHREFDCNEKNIKRAFQYIFEKTGKDSFKVLDLGCGQWI